MWHASVLFINFARIACLPHGLCNGTVSVRLSSLSVQSVDRCSSLRRVCCCGPRRQAISIDCCTSRLHICSGGTALSSKREQCHVVS